MLVIEFEEVPMLNDNLRKGCEDKVAGMIALNTKLHGRVWRL